MYCTDRDPHAGGDVVYIAAVLYPGGSLMTITKTHSEAADFIHKMKERLSKANEKNAIGYVFCLGEAAEVIR